MPQKLHNEATTLQIAALNFGVTALIVCSNTGHDGESLHSLVATPDGV